MAPGEISTFDRLLRETDARLRLVHADCAAEDAESRDALLADELERALQAVEAGRRDEFLRALEDRFPTWDARVDVSGGADARPRSIEDHAEIGDFAWLTQRLADLAPGLNDRQKRFVRDQLLDAGMMPGVATAAAAADPEADARIADALQVRDGQPDGRAVLAIADLLLREIVKIDAAARRTMRDWDPQSRVGGRDTLREDLARFATGDGQVTREQLDRALLGLRALLLAQLSAVGQGAGKWATDFVRRFRPNQIKAVAEQEGGFLKGSVETRCWKVYERQAEAELSDHALKDDVLKSIAEVATAHHGRQSG